MHSSTLKSRGLSTVRRRQEAFERYLKDLDRDAGPGLLFLASSAPCQLLQRRAPSTVLLNICEAPFNGMLVDAGYAADEIN